MPGDAVLALFSLNPDRWQEPQALRRGATTAVVSVANAVHRRVGVERSHWSERPVFLLPSLRVLGMPAYRARCSGVTTGGKHRNP